MVTVAPFRDGAATLGSVCPRGNAAPPKLVLHGLQHTTAYHHPMDDLAFDDLKLFSRVAALGSLSAVARERDAPVSQVSRALARIEKSFGAGMVEMLKDWPSHANSISDLGPNLVGYYRWFWGLGLVSA